MKIIPVAHSTEYNVDYVPIPHADQWLAAVVVGICLISLIVWYFKVELPRTRKSPRLSKWSQSVKDYDPKTDVYNWKEHR